MRLQSINQYTDVCCWRMWFTQVLLTELTASLNSSKIKLRIRITIINQSINFLCTHNELVVGPKRSVYNARRQSLFSLPEIIEISSSTGQAANIIIKSPWEKSLNKYTITPFKERQHFFAMCNSNKSNGEHKTDCDSLQHHALTPEKQISNHDDSKRNRQLRERQLDMKAFDWSECSFTLHQR